MKNYRVIVILGVTLMALFFGWRSFFSTPGADVLRDIQIIIKDDDCDDCVRRVKRAIKTLRGVYDVEVNWADRRALLSIDERRVSANQVLEAVHNAGIEAVLGGADGGLRILDYQIIYN